MGKPSIQGLSREGFIREVRVHSESDVREAMKRHPHRASYLILSPYLTISSPSQIALLPWVNQIPNSEESAVNITKTNKFSQPMDFSPSSLLLKCFSLLSQPEFHSFQSRASCTFSAYIYLCFIQIPWLLSLQSIGVWIIFFKKIFFLFVSYYLFPQNTVAPLGQTPDLTLSGMFSS